MMRMRTVVTVSNEHDHNSRNSMIAMLPVSSASSSKQCEIRKSNKRPQQG